MDLSRFFLGGRLEHTLGRSRPARRRGGWLSGRIADERPDVNKLRVRPVVLREHKHDTSGVRRAVRRGSRSA